MGIKPKLRPKDDEFKKIVAAANSGDGGNAAPAAKGGKGGGKSVNPLAKEGSADYKKMQKANTDNSYGYYDVNTGDYVPWYIDIQNGGGMNTAGPTFEGGFGTAGLIGGLLNAAGVSPYGQDRPRAFMPMEAYRGGDDKPAPFDYRGGGSAAPAPTGVIDAAVEPPDANVPPVNPYAVGGGFSETAPAAVVTTAASEDAYNTPRMYRSMDRQVGLFNQAQNSDPIMLPVGADAGRAELARLRLQRQQVVGNRPVPQDDMPAILSFGGGERPPLPAMSPSNIGVGNRPSDPTMATPPEAMTMFTARMNTVPEMVRGTQIEEMYRKYLLSGNTGTFGQFTGAQP